MKELSLNGIGSVDENYNVHRKRIKGVVSQRLHYTVFNEVLRLPKVFDISLTKLSL